MMSVQATAFLLLFCCRFVHAYLVHHWSQANKKNLEFVKTYPFCNSIKDMVIWLVIEVDLYGHTPGR
jgi:hypothetical protein